MNDDKHIRDALMLAALDCGHTITSDAIALFRSSTAAGNALAQLSDRLLSAHQMVAPASFQTRVQPWMTACFGAEISADREERNHRFIEEALELVQANGCTQSEAHQLVDYVYGRPVGELPQEVGGVMVTLAALCLASGVDMHACGETELARIWTKVEAIRAKQAAKPKHSPLPEAVAAPAQPAAEAAPRWERGVATVTMTGNQLREALEFINPDGPADELQAEDELTFGVVQHKDDDGKVTAGLCCWNDDTDGVYPLHGEPVAQTVADAAPVEATDAMAMAVRKYDVFDMLPDRALIVVAKSIYRDMQAAAQPSPAQGDALSQAAGNWPADFREVVAGAEKAAHELGRAAGMEEAATVSEKTNSHGKFIAAAIRALAIKPAEGGAL